MKPPKKPQEPYPIVIPAPPSEVTTTYKDTYLCLSMQEARMTIADFAIQIRGELEVRHLPCDSLITFNSDNDPYEGTYNGFSISVSIPTEVPNKRFTEEFERYLVSLPHWEKLKAEYEKKLAVYKDRLEAYLIEHKKYSEFKQKSEIEKLELRLKQLKEKK